MRTLDGKLIVDLNDNVDESVQGNATLPDKVTINENATNYRLLPLNIGSKLPIVVGSVYDKSTPQILKDDLSIESGSGYLYQSPDGTVRVTTGVSFTFSLEAKQPTYYNITNGIVDVNTSTDEDISYVWYKDGNAIPSGSIVYLEVSGYNQQQQTNPSTIKSTGTSLVFENITPSAEGSYFCEIRNSAGATISEQITISVLNPLSSFDNFFGKNIIQNGFATDDVNGWSNAQGAIKSVDFLKNSPTAAESIEVTLKRPETNIFGYIPEQFYPYPKNIRPININDYRLVDIANGKAKYFSRDSLQSIHNNGQKKVIAYQDVDLTDIVPYIQGRVYGVKGIKAFFGCYIGNALSKTQPVIESTPASRRYLKQFFYQGAPRLSVENFLRVGGLYNEESVKVYVQEYNNNQLLASSILDDIGNVTTTKKIELVDPITREIQNTIQRANTIVGESVPVYPEDQYNIGYTLKTKDPENIILKTYQRLYQSIDRYYSHGQYVDYSTVCFDKLNPNTNKIRISLVFDFDSDRFYEYVDNLSNGLLDLTTWDKTNPRGSFRSQYKDWNDPNLKHFYSIVEDSADSKQTKDVTLKYLSGTNSRTLVTGLGLSLHPIMEQTKDLVDEDNTKFKASIITIPSKQYDLTNRSILKSPLQASGSFNKDAFIIEDWKIVIENRVVSKTNPYGEDFVTRIKPQKKDEVTGEWVDQSRFPIFGKNALAQRNKKLTNLGSARVNFKIFEENNDITYSKIEDVPSFVDADYDWWSGIIQVNYSDTKQTSTMLTGSLNQIQKVAQQIATSKLPKLAKDALKKGLEMDSEYNFRLLFFGRDIGGKQDGMLLRPIYITQGQEEPAEITWDPGILQRTQSHLKFRDAVIDPSAIDNGYGLDLDFGKAKDELYVFKVYREVNGSTVPLEDYIYDDSVIYRFSYEVVNI